MSCARKSSEGDSDTLVSFSPRKTVTSVKTINATYKVFEQVIQSNGKIKPTLEQTLLSPLVGLIRNCSIRNGQNVNSGQELITYYSDSFERKLRRSQTELFKARMEYKSELLGYSSSAGIVADSIVQLLKASSGLTQAEIELEEIQSELKKVNIVAPFAGRIRNVKIQKDWSVNLNDELLTIYSDDNLYAEISILETDISMVNLETPAEVTTIAAPGRIYKAKVSEINPHVDENGLVSVKLKLLRTDGLLPGMNVNTLIHIPNQTTLAVPREAVVLRSGKTVVFTLDNGLAKWNYVTTSRENGKEIEIVQGLKEGQKVIITNNLQLSHDAAVKEDN